MLKLKARFHLKTSADGDPAGPRLSKFFRVSRSAKIQRSQRNSPWIRPALVSTAGMNAFRIRLLAFHCTSCAWLWLRPPATNHPGPKAVYCGDVDTVAITAHSMDNGDINNEIDFSGDVKALNLNVATLTPLCNSNVPSLGRESR